MNWPAPGQFSNLHDDLAPLGSRRQRGRSHRHGWRPKGSARANRSGSARAASEAAPAAAAAGCTQYTWADVTLQATGAPFPFSAQRSADGKTLVLRAVMPAAPAFAGACTAAAGAAAAGNGDGYLLPVLNTLGAFFTILPSGTPPI